MRALSLRFVVLFALLLVTPSCAFMGYTAKDVSFSDKPIAKLIHHEGTVLIMTQGKWGVLPEAGMQLYSEDKVVTFNGAATIEFYDAARVGICDNTDIQITQRIQKWAPFRTVRDLERGVVLYMGKIYFRTGKEKVLNHFVTPTLVFSLYYGKGNLSIDSEQDSYILLEKGMTTFKVGEYKYGEADQPTDIKANASPLLQAALSADVAASQAKLAQTELAAGRMTQAQADWYQAQAEEASLSEKLTCDELLKLYNPEQVVWNQAKKAVNDDNKAIELVRAAKEKAVREGAIPPGKEQPAEKAAPEAALPETVNEGSLPNAPAEASSVTPTVAAPAAPAAPAEQSPSYGNQVAPSYITPAQPVAAPPESQAAPAETQPAPSGSQVALPESQAAPEPAPPESQAATPTVQ